MFRYNYKDRILPLKLNITDHIIFTARIRRMGEGNVFDTRLSMILSVHRGGGGGQVQLAGGGGCQVQLGGGSGPAGRGGGQVQPGGGGGGQPS